LQSRSAARMWDPLRPECAQQHGHRAYSKVRPRTAWCAIPLTAKSAVHRVSLELNRARFELRLHFFWMGVAARTAWKRKLQPAATTLMALMRLQGHSSRTRVRPKHVLKYDHRSWFRQAAEITARMSFVPEYGLPAAAHSVCSLADLRSSLARGGRQAFVPPVRVWGVRHGMPAEWAVEIPNSHAPRSETC
jgi:hypothetical protein